MTLPTFDVYQLLRGVQAGLAALGIWLSFTNLRDAYLDQSWLMEEGINGVRAVTASSLVIHECGRFLMQVVLFTIGALGMVIDGGAGTFDNVETFLDTLVVVIVVLVSWHARYVRTSIRHWRIHHQTPVRPRCEELQDEKEQQGEKE